MPRVDTWKLAVESMLEQWGREFSLHREPDGLGFATKNLLYEVIRHAGPPPRATGYKPLEINLQALAVEYAVMEIGRTDPATAWVLRAAHCSYGRRRYERFWKANELLSEAGLPNVRLAAYLDLVTRGEQRLSQILVEEATC